jgi:CRP-like cAMP-binding protein
MTNGQKKQFTSKLTEKTFNIGDKFIVEGSPINYIYFILKGECRLYSNINPLNLSVSKEGNIVVTEVND